MIDYLVNHACCKGWENPGNMSVLALVNRILKASVCVEHAIAGQLLHLRWVASSSRGCIHEVGCPLCRLGVQLVSTVCWSPQVTSTQFSGPVKLSVWAPHDHRKNLTEVALKRVLLPFHDYRWCWVLRLAVARLLLPRLPLTKFVMPRHALS